MSAPAAVAPRRRLHFSYVWTVYLVTAGAETLISPLFPLVRQSLGLDVADQAVLTSVLTFSIGVANLLGGWLGWRHGDRLAIRTAAGLICVGATISGAAPGLGVLLVGQAILGVGVGIFFGPGLSTVGRIYAEARGRATASYGLAYSVGPAIAALSSNAGVAGWRTVFFACAGFSGVLAVLSPALERAPVEPGTRLVAEARSYLGLPLFRLALLAGVTSGVIYYVVIGLTPEHFVGRGVSLGLVTGLVAAGRVASVAAKYLAGWMFDRWGPSRSLRALLAAITGLGGLQMFLPGNAGLVVTPVLVCAVAMVFPVANAVLVTALPPNASWGVGIYRALLMGSTALCSAAIGVQLRFVSSTAALATALLLPLLGTLAVGRWWPAPAGRAPDVAVGGGEGLR